MIPAAQELRPTLKATNHAGARTSARRHALARAVGNSPASRTSLQILNADFDYGLAHGQLPSCFSWNDLRNHNPVMKFQDIIDAQKRHLSQEGQDRMGGRDLGSENWSCY